RAGRSEASGQGSEQLLPIILCRYTSCKPDSVRDRVGSHVWEHVMDSNDRSANPECDPSLCNGYSLQRYRNLSHRYLSKCLHCIRRCTLSHCVRFYYIPVTYFHYLW